MNAERVRDRTVLLTVGLVFAAAAFGHGYVSQREARAQLDGLVTELGGAVCDSTAVSVRGMLAVVDELEREIERSLRLKATFLADSVGQDGRVLHRFTLAAGLRHILLFDPEGRLRAVAEDVPAPERSGLLEDSLALAREAAARTLLERNEDLVVSEWRVPGDGRESSLAVAARLPDGSMAVLVEDTQAFARARRAADPGGLADRLAAETRLRFVSYGGPLPAYAPEDVAVFEREVAGQPLRVGIDRSAVRVALGLQLRTALLYGSLFVLLATGAAWALQRVHRARAALQERLDRDERLASLGRLAANIAHEVRNPLNAIGIAAQRMQREAEPEMAGLGSVVADEVRRLDRTVEEVLRLARPTTPRRRAISAGDVLGALETLARPEAEARGVALRVATARATALLADPDMIRAAAWNLVLNALHATPAGGRVDVTARERQQAFVLEVTDGGPGIPPDRLARIFEPFESQRGTGLGLPLALSAAEAHGGTIEVETNPQGGTIFRLVLPGKTPR